jgi:hypothetical protein
MAATPDDVSQALEEATQGAGTSTEGQTPETTEGSTYRIKAGGVERELTLDELKTWASKGYGADEKFREAASKTKDYDDVRKKAEEHDQFMTDLQAARSGDAAALRRVGPHFGLDDEAVERIIAQQEQAAAGSYGESPDGGAPAFASLDPRQAAILTKFESFMNDLQKEGIEPGQAIKASREYLRNESRQKLTENLRKALTNDKDLGRIVANDESGTIHKAVADQIEWRVRAGEELTPKAIQEVFQQVKAISDATLKAVPQPKTGVPHPGAMGMAPATGSGLSQLQPPKVPKLEDSDPERFDDYVQKRILAELYGSDG